MAEQPAGQPASRYTPGAWPLSRLLMLIACACFILAALLAADVFTWTSPWAWGFGGFAAACLSWAAP